MHEQSMILMSQAIEDVIAPEPISVLDVGSMFINGSYREMIEARGWQYTGLDIFPGPNVDILAENPYHYPLETGQFDLVITGSVAYAVLDLVSWFRELARVTKPGGRLIVITPSLTKPPTTASPADLWRMTDAALKMLFEYTNVFENVRVQTSHHDVVATGTRVHGEIDEPMVSPMPEQSAAKTRDSVTVTRKPAEQKPKRKAG